MQVGFCHHIILYVRSCTGLQDYITYYSYMYCSLNLYCVSVNDVVFHYIVNNKVTWVNNFVIHWILS